MIALEGSVSNSGEKAAVTSSTHSHTNTSATFLAVGLGIRDNADEAATGVTFNGDALTKILHSSINPAGTAVRAEWWYRVNPDTVTGNIVVSWANAVNFAVVGGISLTGVDINNPIVGYDGQTGGPGGATIGTDISVMAENAWILDAVFTRSGTAPTVASSQTQRINQGVNTNSDYFVMSTKAITSVVNELMQWNVATGEDFAQALVSIKPDDGLTMKSVTVGTDDSEEIVSSTVNDVTSTDLEMTYDAAAQLVGVRFQGLDIPPGATITSCVIRFVVDEDHSGANDVDIYGEDADDAATFANTNANISGRTLTTATVNWDLGTTVGSVTNDVASTPDLSSILQEIVDRAGWASGNDVVFIFKDGSVTNFRTFESYEGEPENSPHLFFSYTEAGGAVIKDVIGLGMIPHPR